MISYIMLYDVTLNLIFYDINTIQYQHHTLYGKPSQLWADSVFTSGNYISACFFLTDIFNLIDHFSLVRISITETYNSIYTCCERIVTSGNVISHFRYQHFRYVRCINKPCRICGRHIIKIPQSHWSTFKFLMNIQQILSNAETAKVMSAKKNNMAEIHSVENVIFWYRSAIQMGFDHVSRKKCVLCFDDYH